MSRRYLLFIDLSWSVFLAEVLDKAKVHIGTLKDQYSRLADILSECPDQYYRSYYDHFGAVGSFAISFTYEIDCNSCLSSQVSWWLEKWNADCSLSSGFHALFGDWKSAASQWGWGKTWMYATFLLSYVLDVLCDLLFQWFQYDIPCWYTKRWLTLPGCLLGLQGY